MVSPAFAAAAIAGVLIVSGPAQLTRAGSGAAEVSGFVVSEITYEDAAEPGSISSVSLTLDKDASKVQVQLGLASRSASCSVTEGRRWRCPFEASVPVKEVRRLRVVASGNA